MKKWTMDIFQKFEYVFLNDSKNYGYFEFISFQIGKNGNNFEFQPCFLYIEYIIYLLNFWAFLRERCVWFRISCKKNIYVYFV